MKRLVISLIALFVMGQAYAQQRNGEAHSAFQTVMTKVQTARLSNGLRVLLYRRGFAPVFSAIVAVRVGGSDETLGSTGISHLLEHMAFKGTPQIGTKDYERERVLLAELEELAARETSLSAQEKSRWQAINAELLTLWVPDQFSREYEKRGATGLNATTDQDQTRYFVSLPRSAFDFWCNIEAQRLLFPVMRQFYQERDVVLEERRMRYEDDPGGKLYELLLGMAYRVHPYRNPTIGYMFDVSKLTATMVADLQQRFYVPENMVITVVGDVIPETDLPALEQCFGKLPVGPVPARPQITEPRQQGERRFTLEERGSPQLMIAYHKPNYPHPDEPALSVMAEILAGSRVSPLYQDLVKRKRIAASVSFGEAPGSSYPNLLIFSMVPKAPHTNAEVLKAFDRIVEAFKTRFTDLERLEIAKRALTMAYLQGLDSNMSLALALSEAELLHGHWQILFDWLDQALQVSLDDVHRVARQYLVPETRTIANLENRGKD